MMKKRNGIHRNIPGTAFHESAARFGIKAGRGVFEAGRGAVKLGEKGYKFGKEAMAMRKRVIEQQSGRTNPERQHTEKPMTAEEKIARMRERKLEKSFERLPEGIAEDLQEKIAEAMEGNMGAIEMHRMLRNYFRENCYFLGERTSAMMIRSVLLVTHPNYGRTIKVE